MSARRKYRILNVAAVVFILGSFGFGFGTLWWWAIRDIDREIGAACVVTTIALALMSGVAWSWADVYRPLDGAR